MYLHKMFAQRILQNKYKKNVQNGHHVLHKLKTIE